jgi:hypothetical protein
MAWSSAHGMHTVKRTDYQSEITDLRMISEVCPRGKEFLFFSLFSIIGKTSSFIGPFISSAIINASGNNNMPFAFLFALSIVSCGIIACVSPRKSRIECFKYIESEKARLELKEF